MKKFLVLLTAITTHSMASSDLTKSMIFEPEDNFLTSQVEVSEQNPSSLMETEENKEEITDQGSNAISKDAWKTIKSEINGWIYVGSNNKSSKYSVSIQKGSSQ